MNRVLRLQPPRPAAPQSIAPIPDRAVFRVAARVEFRSAGVMDRVIAFSIDAVISGSMSGLLVVLLFRPLGFSISAGFLSFLACAAVYWAGVTKFDGATPGKKIMGLKVICSDGELKISWARLFWRETVGRILSLVTFGAGYLWCLLRRDRRTLHDLVSGTRVIEFR